MGRSSAEAAWQAVWTRRGWQARLLWPLSTLYGLLAERRRQQFAADASRVQRMPVPVIVVGNVVVGGAGKTPTVLALLAHLQSAGWHPGVVSRGHGRHGSGVLELQADTPASEGGDEPTLIRRRSGVPVFVGAQRVDAARALLAAHPQVDLLLCDDGLQHYALGRDLGIAVFDDRGTGNGWLLPAGLLREPWPPVPGSAFVPHVVLQQSRHATPPRLPALPDGVVGFHATRRLSDHALGPQGQRLTLEALAGTELMAVAGIARPDAFFGMLRERGLPPQEAIALPDHAAPENFDAVLPRASTATVLCTEKDAVKLWPLLLQRPQAQRPSVWAVPLELLIDPAFFAAVDRCLLPHVPGGRLSSADGQQTA